MNSKNENLLLKEYKTSIDSNQLILSTYSKEPHHPSNYFQQILNKYSTFEISKVLEIYPLDSTSLEVEFRKMGFNVISIPFSLDVNAVGGNKDGSHYIIGKTFNFPVINERFDAIIVTQGIFGQILQPNDIKTFLTHLNSLLSPNGILMELTKLH